MCGSGEDWQRQEFLGHRGELRREEVLETDMVSVSGVLMSGRLSHKQTHVGKFYTGASQGLLLGKAS